MKKYNVTIWYPSPRNKIVTVEAEDEKQACKLAIEKFEKSRPGVRRYPMKLRDAQEVTSE